MEYRIRDTVLPAYYQIGAPAMYNGIHVGDIASLDPLPIAALHYHKYYECGICISGTGETHIENRIYRFSPGVIQVVRAGVSHFSCADPGTSASWIWIFLDMQYLMSKYDKDIQQIAAQPDAPSHAVFTREEHPRLAALIGGLIEKGNAETPFSLLENCAIAGQLLCELAKYADTQTPPQQISARLQPALEYIRTNYMFPERMSAKDIAAQCSLSVSHFRVLFHHNVGMTLPEYLVRTRLSACAHLLGSTTQSVSEIAYLCGFRDIPHFNRIFRAAFGMSPTQMRRAHITKHPAR